MHILALNGKKMDRAIHFHNGFLFRLTVTPWLESAAKSKQERLLRKLEQQQLAEAHSKMFVCFYQFS